MSGPLFEEVPNDIAMYSDEAMGLRKQRGVLVSGGAQQWLSHLRNESSESGLCMTKGMMWTLAYELLCDLLAKPWMDQAMMNWIPTSHHSDFAKLEMKSRMENVNSAVKSIMRDVERNDSQAWLH